MALLFTIALESAVGLDPSVCLFSLISNGIVGGEGPPPPSKLPGDGEVWGVCGLGRALRVVDGGLIQLGDGQGRMGDGGQEMVPPALTPSSGFPLWERRSNETWQKKREGGRGADLGRLLVALLPFPGAGFFLTAQEGGGRPLTTRLDPPIESLINGDLKVYVSGGNPKGTGWRPPPPPPPPRGNPRGSDLETKPERARSV